MTCEHYKWILSRGTMWDLFIRLFFQFIIFLSESAFQSKAPSWHCLEVKFEETKKLADHELDACYDLLCQTMRHNSDRHFYTKDQTNT